MKAIRVHTPGPEENLVYEDVPIPTPGPGQALVKLEASGVNFIDIYFRTGLYPTPEKPFGIGMEGAGVVMELGTDAPSYLKIGDRVAYASQRGSYAEYAVVPAWTLVPVPTALDSESAAALMLQGMTVHYLTHSTFALGPGHTCLIHAAAGGVGLILTQVAKMLGATVIGTTSTPEKAALVKSAGADHVIGYDNVAVEVRRIVDQGVHVVYDSVGAATFQGSIDSLRPRGMMVTFGNASGPVPAMEPLLLSQKGSLYLTRPKLFDYALDREEVLGRATAVFDWKMNGHLPVFSTKTYALADAGQAQRDLASRKTSGKLLLKIS